MSNHFVEELTLFLDYKVAAPLNEVAFILVALDDAVHQFHEGVGHEGISLAIQDVRIGSVKFWLSLAGVALPAAKLEADYPGTIAQFLDLIKLGVALTADATLPEYAKTFLSLCAKPVADGRAREVVLGSSHHDGPGIRIDYAAAVTINNYYPSANPQARTVSAANTGTAITSTEPADRRGTETIDKLAATGPGPHAGMHGSVAAPVIAGSRKSQYRSSSTNVDWSLHETSTRDVLLGLALDVGEQTGVIVARDILQRATGRPDIGDPATTDSERDAFEQAVCRGLVADRPFDRTRFNMRSITAMRLKLDDFVDE